MLRQPVSRGTHWFTSKIEIRQSIGDYLISDGPKFGNELNENATKTKVALTKTFQYASRRTPQESRNAYQKGMHHLQLAI